MTDISLDTETGLIIPGVLAPPLVCATFAQDGEADIEHVHGEMHALLEELLDRRDGALWLATGDGLSRYDAARGRFDHFGPAEGLPGRGRGFGPNPWLPGPAADRPGPAPAGRARLPSCGSRSACRRTSPALSLGWRCWCSAR